MKNSKEKKENPQLSKKKKLTKKSELRQNVN